jgi:hypothetical protein
MEYYKWGARILLPPKDFSQPCTLFIAGVEIETEIGYYVGGPLDLYGLKAEASQAGLRGIEDARFSGEQFPARLAPVTIWLLDGSTRVVELAFAAVITQADLLAYDATGPIDVMLTVKSVGEVRVISGDGSDG